MKPKTTYKEDVLLKALGELDAQIQKGSGQKHVDGKPSIPDTTAEANGGFVTEAGGDEEELAAKSQQALEAFAERASKSMADSDDEDDEDDEEEESTSKSMDDEEEDEDLAPQRNIRKSMQKAMDAQSGEDGSLDAMPFLESLIEQVSQSEKGLRKSVQNLRMEQSEFNQVISKALASVCKANMLLNQKLDRLMGQPTGQRRSVVKSEGGDRFVEEGQQRGFKYDHNQVCKALVELAQAGTIEIMAVPAYESTRTMKPDVQQAVIQHLQKKSA